MMRTRTLVKLGGSALCEDDGSLIEQLAKKQSPLVIVHGGGPHISQKMVQLNEKPEFIDGLRKTSENMIDFIAQAFAEINQMLVCSLNNQLAKINKKAMAVGIHGFSSNLITARLHENKLLGQVGVVSKINPQLLSMLLKHNYIPVISPLGLHIETGKLLNINADYAAIELAKALSMDEFVLLSNVPGILDKNKKIISKLTPQYCQELIKDGTISGGMIPKVDCLLQATNKIGKARICSAIEDCGSIISA